MTDLDELRKIAKANGFYHNIEPFDAEIERLTAELREARNTLHEVTTNGEWTEGEQRGEWKISKEVYEMARDHIPEGS